jgi:hypothetical protein
MRLEPNFTFEFCWIRSARHITRSIDSFHTEFKTVVRWDETIGLDGLVLVRI